MAIKHQSSDPPAPPAALPCPFCPQSKSRLALLVIERDSYDKDNGKRWIYCRECGGCGPQMDSNEEAVKSWNAKRKS